jgi:uncharacterized delta-60 repeat protein
MEMEMQMSDLWRRSSVRLTAVFAAVTLLLGGAGALLAPRARAALTRYLDPSFGAHGVATVPLASSCATTMRVFLQPDGSALVAGRSAGAFVRVGLDASGHPTGAPTAINVGGPVFDTMAGADRATDGSIVAAGFVIDEPGDNRNIVVGRFTPTGEPDSSFGTGGLATFDFGTLDFATGVAALPGGGTLVLGPTADNPNSALLKLLPNGTLDPSFGTGGRMFSPAGETWTTLFGAGTSYYLGINHQGTSQVGRFNAADSSPDPTWGPGGRATVSLDSVRRLVVQPDGKVLVADGLHLARLSATGQVDSSFGTVDVSNIVQETSAIAVDGTGRIVLTGDDHLSGSAIVTRLKADGTRDASFASEPIGVSGINGDLGGYVHDIAIDGSNRYWMTIGLFGCFTASPAPSDLGVIRVLGDQTGPIFKPSLPVVARPECVGCGYRWFQASALQDGGGTVTTYLFANAGDIPLMGDWDGDGVRTPGVFRPSTATFYLASAKSDGGGSVMGFQFGNPTDVPVVGDWNGDGKDTVGVFRRSQGRWYFASANVNGGGTVSTVLYGGPSDTPVTGHWHLYGTNGNDRQGAFRASAGTWYLANGPRDDGNGTDPAIGFASPGDIPAVGDWDGAASRLGVFRPSQARWWFAGSESTSGPPLKTILFGNPGDVPLAG